MGVFAGHPQLLVAAGAVKGGSAEADCVGELTGERRGEERGRRSFKLNLISGFFTSEKGSSWQQDNFWHFRE